MMAVIKGIVLDVKDEYVIIATPDGQFIKTEYTGSPPSIGTEIEVHQKPKMFSWKAIATAAAVIIFAFTSFFYLFLYPTAYMAIDINPSIELGISPLRNIVRAEPLNDDGEYLLRTIDIKGQKLESGLKKIIEHSADIGYLKETKINTIQITVVKTGLVGINPVEVSEPIAKKLEETNIGGYVKIRKAENEDIKEAREQKINLNSYMIKKELNKEAEHKIKNKPDLWKKPINEIIEEIGAEQIFESAELKGKKMKDVKPAQKEHKENHGNDKGNKKDDDDKKSKGKPSPENTKPKPTKIEKPKIKKPKNKPTPPGKLDNKDTKEKKPDNKDKKENKGNIDKEKNKINDRINNKINEVKNKIDNITRKRQEK